MYCIFEFDIFDPSYEELGTRSSKWMFEVPCSVESVLDIDDGKLCCLRNLMEEKISSVMVIFMRPLDDFVYVTNDLNLDYNSFKFHGKKKFNNVDFYVYSKVITKENINE